MFKYIAKDNDRLDTIVYQHYGTLDFFPLILDINSQLPPLLKAGDVVFLPEVRLDENKEENALW